MNFLNQNKKHSIVAHLKFDVLDSNHNRQSSFCKIFSLAHIIFAESESQKI